MIARACYVVCDRCGDPAEISTEGAKHARAVAAKTERFIRVNREDVCGRCRDIEAGGEVCAVCGAVKEDFRAHYPWSPCVHPDARAGSDGGR